MRRGTLSTAVLAMALAGVAGPAVEVPIRRNDDDDFDRLIRKRAKEQWGAAAPPRRNPWKQEALERARRAETPAQSAARRSKELQAQKRKSRKARGQR